MALLTSSIFAVSEQQPKAVEVGDAGICSAYVCGMSICAAGPFGWIPATKNGEGREVAMTPEVEEFLRAAVEGKRPDDCVFTHEDGKPVKDFPGAWRNLRGT